MEDRIIRKIDDLKYRIGLGFVLLTLQVGIIGALILIVL